jgi:hypothetical protein
MRNRSVLLIFALLLSTSIVRAQQARPENILGIPWDASHAEVDSVMSHLPGVELRSDMDGPMAVVQYGGSTYGGREVREWVFGFIEDSLALAYVEYESGSQAVYDAVCHELTDKYGEPFRLKSTDTVIAVPTADPLDEELIGKLLETEEGAFTLWGFGKDHSDYFILCAVNPPENGSRPYVTLGYFDRSGLERLFAEETAESE